MTNTIQYAVDQDGIALLTIDLPGMPMNVLTPELMEDLSTLTERAATDDAVKGKGAFDIFILEILLKEIGNALGKNIKDDPFIL